MGKSRIAGDDLTVPVRVPRADDDQSLFSAPAFLSSLGTAFVPGEAGLVAIHYRHPDATSLPAVRDLTGVFDAR